MAHSQERSKICDSSKIAGSTQRPDRPGIVLFKEDAPEFPVHFIDTINKDHLEHLPAYRQPPTCQSVRKEVCRAKCGDQRFLERAYFLHAPAIAHDTHESPHPPAFSSVPQPGPQPVSSRSEN